MAMSIREPGPWTGGRAPGPARVGRGPQAPVGRAAPTHAGAPFESTPERISGRARIPGGPPPVGGPGGRGRPPGDGPPPALVRRRRPRWRRILVITLVTLLVLTGVGAGALLLYARGLNDNMSRTDAFSQLAERPDKLVEGSLNVLLLGSDSRDPDGDSGGPYRADTIMLMHLPANQNEAYFISIPRDLWVPIPPTPDGSAGGHNAKINAATAFGGVPLMVQAVESYTGVLVDHVVLVDFGGFVEVTDAVGGVEMDIEQTITSIHKPNRTFPEGRNLLNGEEALDYIRQRYQFPDGDFTRMRNQQQFLRALMDKAVSSGTLSDPRKLHTFLQTVTETLTVDEEFSMLGMGWRLRNLRGDDLHFLTSPHNGAGRVGDQSVVLSDDAGAAALYEAIREDRIQEWATAHLADEGGG